jgi:hypothetical protein
VNRAVGPRHRRGIAIASAVPALRARADLVTRSGGEAGVVEIVERMIASDLAEGSALTVEDSSCLRTGSSD